MYHEPAAFGGCSISSRACDGVSARAGRVGAAAVQVFDSWVGALAVEDYHEHVLPHTRRSSPARTTSGPRIHFGVDTATFLARSRRPADVVSVDWRLPLDEAWGAIGLDKRIQGNLDPAVLLGPARLVRERAADVLRRAGGGRGTSSTSATACCRRRRSRTSSCWSTRYTRRVLAPDPRTGILCMAYGSPADDPAAVAAYYTHIRGGRAPSPERLADLAMRYNAIGGSPLNGMTAEQAAALGDQLALPAFVGMKHAPPFIADGAAQAAARGIERLVGLAAGAALRAHELRRLRVGVARRVVRRPDLYHGLPHASGFRFRRAYAAV